MRRRGFTLVELMVVVAIIVALLALLLPSLNRAIASSEIAVCSSNHHQIAAAAAAYAQDNLGLLVGSHTSAGLAHAWVASPTSATAENLDHLRNGKLWPYLNTPGVYRCPTDPRTTYIRSYSMSMYPGGVTGWHIRPAGSLNQIDNPGGRMLTLDEADPRGHNNGAWAVYPKGHASQESWIDWPAPWHLGNGNTMSFVDGHVAFYRFVDPNTARIAAFYTSAPNNPDLDYYQSIYAPYP